MKMKPFQGCCCYAGGTCFRFNVSRAAVGVWCFFGLSPERQECEDDFSPRADCAPDPVKKTEADEMS